MFSCKQLNGGARCVRQQLNDTNGGGLHGLSTREGSWLFRRSLRVMKSVGVVWERLMDSWERLVSTSLKFILLLRFHFAVIHDFQLIDSYGFLPFKQELTEVHEHSPWKFVYRIVWGITNRVLRDCLVRTIIPASIPNEQKQKECMVLISSWASRNVSLYHSQPTTVFVYVFWTHTYLQTWRHATRSSGPCRATYISFNRVFVDVRLVDLYVVGWIRVQAASDRHSEFILVH